MLIVTKNEENVTTITPDEEVEASTSDFKNKFFITNGKPNTKSLLILGVVAFLLIAILLFFAISNHQVNTVVKNLKEDNISVAIDNVEKLNFAAEKIFKSKIINALEESVQNNPYNKFDDGNSVYVSAIQIYKQYSLFANEVGLTNKDTTCLEYINTVLQLDGKEKYNQIIKSVDETKNDLLEAARVIDTAQSSNSSFVQALGYYTASEKIDTAYEISNKYDGYLTKEYSKALITWAGGATAYGLKCVGESHSGVSLADFTIGYSNVSKIIEEVQSQKEEIEKIVNDINN